MWIFAEAWLDNSTKRTDSLQITVHDSPKPPTLSWHHDSISATVNENQILYLSLDDSVAYTGSGVLVFSTLPGGPAGDTIRFAGYYECAASYADSGHYRVRIRVSDEQIADTLAIGLTIRNANRSPAFVANSPNQGYSIDENASLHAIVRATDLDGDYVKCFVDSSGLPRAQSAALTDTVFAWSSRLGDVGLYRVVFGATDGTDTTYTTVAVGVGAVNMPPTLSIAGVANDQTVSVKEGETLAFTITRRDDNTGDAVRFVPPVLNAPWTDGKGTGGFDTASGVFTYAPGFSTSTRTRPAYYDSVTFRAVDDGTPAESTTLRINIHVVDSNRAPTISLKSPTNGATGVRRTPTLSWSASDPDGDSLTYEVSFGTVSGQLESIGQVHDTSFTCSTQLSAGVTYFWQVVADDGRMRAASVTRSFKINLVPTVDLNTPQNGAVGIAVPTALVWTGGDGDAQDVPGLRYDLYCARSDSTMRRVVADTGAASISLAHIAWGATYSWKVVVKDGKDSAASATARFSTLIPDARLSALSMVGNSGTLTPVFSADISAYTCETAYLPGYILVTAVPSQPGATVSINGVLVASGQVDTVHLPVAGSNHIDVAVTAIDGTTQRIYSIEATRRPPPPFQHAYGSPEDEYGCGIALGPNHGYVLAGTKGSTSARSIMLVRTDATGDTIWTREIGDALNGYMAHDLARLQSGNYVVCGESRLAAGTYLFYAIFDTSGTLFRQKGIGPSGGYTTTGHSVAPTADGGFAIAGESILDCYIAKFSSTGDSLWSTRFGSAKEDLAYTIMELPDRSLWVAGSSEHASLSSNGVFAAHVSASGDTLWTRRYWGSEQYHYDVGYGVARSSQGRMLIVGSSQSMAPSGSVLFALTLDSLGDSVGCSMFNYGGYGCARDVIRNSAGGVAVVGNAGDNARFLLLDATAHAITEKTFGGASSDDAVSVVETPDGGYAILGSTTSFGAGGSDLYLIKTDSTGAAPTTP
jgi:hypothetical protein